MNESERYSRRLNELPENLPEILPNFYEILLKKYPDYFHHVVQGIINCKIADIKRTKCEDMSEVLNYFIGTSPHKQKEKLIEFLTLMPEFRTVEQNALNERLKTLTEELKKAGDVMDPLVYAMYKTMKYNQTLENNT